MDMKQKKMAIFRHSLESNTRGSTFEALLPENRGRYERNAHGSETSSKVLYSPFQCMNSARLSRPTELLAFQKKSRLHRLEADFDEALEKAPQLREASKNLFIFNFRVSFFVTVFAPKSKKGFLMLQMSHNG